MFVGWLRDRMSIHKCHVTQGNSRSVGYINFDDFEAQELSQRCLEQGAPKEDVSQVVTLAKNLENEATIIEGMRRRVTLAKGFYTWCGLWKGLARVKIQDQVANITGESRLGDVCQDFEGQYSDREVTSRKEGVCKSRELQERGDFGGFAERKKFEQKIGVFVKYNGETVHVGL